MEFERLTAAIIARSFAVHDGLGPGFLESVYRNALAHELRAAGHEVVCEMRLEVRYRDIVCGEYVADAIVDGRVLLELKAVKTLAAIHEAQVHHYLLATGLTVGLLINFGAPTLEFRRKAGPSKPWNETRSDRIGLNPTT